MKADGPFPPYSVSEVEHGPYWPYFWVVDDHGQQIEGPYLDRLTAQRRADVLNKDDSTLARKSEFSVRVNELVRQIRFNDWRFLVIEDTARRLVYLQVEFEAPDNGLSGVARRQRGRKWYLSLHMTDSEIVQTAFKAVLTAVEHETREQFRYKGQAIFGPHFDIEKLVKLAESGNLNRRVPNDIPIEELVG